MARLEKGVEMPYLTSAAVEKAVQWLATTYPSIATVHVMPEKSFEGRTIRALKIAGGGGSRNGILFLGGVHARELVNPDLLVSLAADLCSAYTGGTGLTYGGKEFDAQTVKLVVDALDVWILPLVNPDGRAYVQAPTGDVWWRKNRRPTGQCVGIDINRNYSFLWSSGIGTSADPCDYQIYKGPSAFSEPETRNVRHMLDTFTNIDCLVDVHSYSEDILYPWGDDNNQTTDPTMNFHNPTFDGLRGTPGDTVYQEYIPEADINWYESVSSDVSKAIQAVRGTVYTTKQSIGLYPTSATSDDYAYSRSFENPAMVKVRGFTVETGKVFQPPYSEAQQIIREVSAGLLQFCLANICVVSEVTRSTSAAVNLDGLRALRDDLASDELGGRLVRLLDQHSVELALALAADAQLTERAAQLLGEVDQAATNRHGDRAPIISEDTVTRTRALISDLRGRASNELRAALDEVDEQLDHFTGKTIVAGLALANTVIRRAEAGANT
jgi:carboxypeptidase T